jgi:hypothetical protein
MLRVLLIHLTGLHPLSMGSRKTPTLLSNSKSSSSKQSPPLLLPLVELVFLKQALAPAPTSTQVPLEAGLWT